MKRRIVITLLLAFTLIIMTSCGILDLPSINSSIKDSTVGSNITSDSIIDSTLDSTPGDNEGDNEPRPCLHLNKIVDPEVPPTCLAEGLTDGKHCGDCGEILINQKPISKLNHIEVEKPDCEATCTEPGTIGRTYCQMCEKVMNRGSVTPAIGHTEEIVKGYPSTCDKAGLSDGKYCAVCDTMYVKQVELERASHTEVITKAIAPTCQSVGYTEKRQCSVCNEVTVESIEIPKSDHTVVTDKAVAPTCKSTGLTEGSHCSVCSKIIVAQQTIPVGTSHVYDSFAVVTKAPSLSSSGTGSITCSECGHKEELTFPQLSATKLTKNDIYSIDTEKFNPAYDNRWKVVDGKTNVSSIYDSGDWFGNVGDVLVITLDQEIVLTSLQIYAGGNYTSATVRVKDAGGNVTKKQDFTVNASSKVVNIASNTQIKAYTIEIEIKSIKWNDARTLKIAEVEITGAKQDTRIEHTHAFREHIENTRVPTCQQTGLDKYACYCGKTAEIESSKGDHIFSTLIQIKTVSCTENGSAIYECICGETTTVETVAKGHIYYKFLEYIVKPTTSTTGIGNYKCINCTLTSENVLPPIDIEEVNYLRVDKIENGKVVLKLNIYGDRPYYEVRYSASPITEENFASATLIDAIVSGEKLVTLTIKLNAGLDNCYYVAVKPYEGDNYGKMATVRVGGNDEITIDYGNAQVYHGEVLNSFKALFDNDIETKLDLIFRNSGDTAVLYGSRLSPIIDLEYLHYVSKASLYFAEAGKVVTVRWSDTPLDFQADDSLWDGCQTIVSQQGWNDLEISESTRYIQVIFIDGHSPCEIKAYGYQCGEGDEIATERGELPSIGEMMGMCGFVASGGGNTPIDEVSCVTVLREYHNFGWSYAADSYGSKASFFTGSWMGNFDSQYRKYTEAGLNVIPCIQWSLGKEESISYKVGSNNLPIYSDGKLVKASFWERFNPHTYFVFADNMFAFSARYGSNSSSTLLEIAKLHCSDVPSVGQGTVKWIEMGNEPDGSWNGIHNYLAAYHLAAATSAAYDGHCRTMVSPVTGGYHLGGKNADPNIKMALAGVSGVSNEYIMAMCYWMKANREDGKTAFDAFNVHHYMTKQLTLSNGATCSVGISPEEADIAGLLSHLIGIRDKYYPEKEVWITEFGWDTNQSYATSTSAHAYGEYTGRQVQAMWLTRTYLILSASGIDKADMYMCHDTGEEETSVGKYGTSGVIAYKSDSNGNLTKEKKDSYYYLYTLKNTLGAYTFEAQVEAYDESVMIYKYKNDDGKTAYAVWCKTSDGTKHEGYQLGINAECATLVETAYGDIDGVSSSLTADEYGYVSVNVSENPVYIIVD
ncbi:MAG: hypothetical protein J6B34_03535 [Clostridia bacterium]|nr:hypothetical protein [Clostridia bacterium]